MRNDCKWCEEEKDDLVYMKYEFEEGAYCQECRKKISNGEMDEYYEGLKNEDYFINQDFPEEPWESRVRRQTQDCYGICNICGKNRNYGNCSCV
ncbi:hypothetical protein [Bacillus sp. REN3]|uniref:hypothetical protein n=1 Tax=Bacillus sp. REN3 TaxID=2802440 RepID=UPI001AEE3F51|nr:hypothetical protein [Bacillus sp. REN3]